MVIGLRGTENAAQPQGGLSGIVWPLLVIALLIWLERENSGGKGFMGGF